MTPNAERVVWTASVATLVGVTVGVLVLTNKDAKAAAPALPSSAWKPVALTRDNVNPSFASFVLGPGTYRLSVDSTADIPSSSPEYVAVLNFAQSIPAEQENKLVTYDTPPSDWPTSDANKPNRVRSQFVVPAGGSARIPEAFHDAVWMKA